MRIGLAGRSCGSRSGRCVLDLRVQSVQRRDFPRVLFEPTGNSPERGGRHEGRGVSTDTATAADAAAAPRTPNACQSTTAGVSVARLTSLSCRLGCGSCSCRRSFCASALESKRAEWISAVSVAWGDTLTWILRVEALHGTPAFNCLEQRWHPSSSLARLWRQYHRPVVDPTAVVFSFSFVERGGLRVVSCEFLEVGLC